VAQGTASLVLGRGIIQQRKVQARRGKARYLRLCRRFLAQGLARCTPVPALVKDRDSRATRADPHTQAEAEAGSRPRRLSTSPRRATRIRKRKRSNSRSTRRRPVPPVTPPHTRAARVSRPRARTLCLLLVSRPRRGGGVGPTSATARARDRKCTGAERSRLQRRRHRQKRRHRHRCTRMRRGGQYRARPCRGGARASVSLPRIQILSRRLKHKYQHKAAVVGQAASGARGSGRSPPFLPPRLALLGVEMETAGVQT
jgi:hypothetical protein